MYETLHKLNPTVLLHPLLPHNDTYYSTQALKLLLVDQPRCQCENHKLFAVDSMPLLIATCNMNIEQTMHDELAGQMQSFPLLQNL